MRLAVRLAGAVILILLVIEPNYSQELSRNALIPNQRDINETIRFFQTNDPAKTVEVFRKGMPPPVMDRAARQKILDNLPSYVAKLCIKDEALVQKVRRLVQPILSIYSRESVYDLIIVDHPTPLMMSDSGVVLVITTGMLLETESEGELVGLIAHEVAHEYLAQYSIYARYLLQKTLSGGTNPLSSVI